jgi:hypothetical protein
MRTVYKYRLLPGTPSVLEVPVGAIFRYLGSQDSGPVLWFEVDTSAPSEQREFFVYGTGHPISESDLVYLGSVQAFDPFLSELVWHVYERLPGEAARLVHDGTHRDADKCGVCHPLPRGG